MSELAAAGRLKAAAAEAAAAAGRLKAAAAEAAAAAGRLNDASVLAALKDSFRSTATAAGS